MADRKLDIRGLLCPLTWARVRREVAGMAPGQTLEVWLDHRPALPDIKRNAAELGHEVVVTTDLGDGSWRLLLEVGAADGPTAFT